MASAGLKVCAVTGLTFVCNRVGSVAQISLLDIGLGILVLFQKLSQFLVFLLLNAYGLKY